MCALSLTTACGTQIFVYGSIAVIVQAVTGLGYGGRTVTGRQTTVFTITFTKAFAHTALCDSLRFDCPFVAFADIGVRCAEVGTIYGVTRVAFVASLPITTIGRAVAPFFLT
jgi:hypothetical protein